MKTHRSFLAAVAVVLGLCASIPAAFAADDISHADKEFLKNASQLGLTEIQLGKLAFEQATSPELKALGGELMAHHGKTNQDLILLAQSKGVDLKMEPTLGQKKMLADFEGKTGAEFDKEWVEHVRRDHEKALKAFADVAADTKDADVKAFALSAIPMMTDHYKRVGGKVERE